MRRRANAARVSYCESMGSLVTAGLLAPNWAAVAALGLVALGPVAVALTRARHVAVGRRLLGGALTSLAVFGLALGLWGLASPEASVLAPGRAEVTLLAILGGLCGLGAWRLLRRRDPPSPGSHP